MRVAERGRMYATLHVLWAEPRTLEASSKPSICVTMLAPAGQPASAATSSRWQDRTSSVKRLTTGLGDLPE